MKIRLLSLILAAFFLALGRSSANEPVPAAAPEAAAPSSLPADQLVAELSRQLTDRFQVRGELKLTLLRTWYAPAPVAGGYQVEILDCPARLTSSLLVRLRLFNAGRPYGDCTLSLQAQVFRNVYAVRTPIERETSFDPAQLDTRRVDVLRERDTVAVDDCTGDFTYTTGVQAGRLLVWRDLTKRALVHKGQIIEVAAIDGAMTVTTRALAMENGAAGDTIKVRNTTSNRDFTASVVADARAEVRF